MSYIAEIPYVGWVPPFLLVLGLVVFVHEYGHYIVGRWCGIKAEAFSIGFGKELWGWTDKHGTRWKVSLLPLGGYVKFLGDMNAASAGADEELISELTPEDRARTFHRAALWKRAATIFAGPFANFLLSIAIFAVVAFMTGKEINEPVVGSVRADAGADLGFQAGDRVVTVNGVYVSSFNEVLVELDKARGETIPVVVNRGAGEQEIQVHYKNPARIDEVMPGGAAAYAGMKRDDVVIAVDGEPLPNFTALRDLVLASEGREMVLTVLRDGAEVELTMSPILLDDFDADGNPIKRPMIGVRNKAYGGIAPMVESAPPLEALEYGYDRTVAIITGSLSYISRIIIGEADSSHLGGPIQIAKVSGQAAEQGWQSLLAWIALISTSVGLINLFPIPVLDGGHLVFYAVEAVRGRPLRARWQEIGNGLGLSLILLLMVFATFNDLTR